MTRRPHTRYAALVLILAALCAGPALAAPPGPAAGTTAAGPVSDDPDAVLKEETRALRDFVMEDDGFLERMQLYREYAEMLSELSATLVEWEPYLAYLDELDQLKSTGMLHMLTLADSRLDFVVPLVEGLSGLRDVLKVVTVFGDKLAVMSVDFDKVLTQPVLRPEDLGALRDSLAVGGEAIAEVETTYAEIRPTLNGFEAQVASMRDQLISSIGQAGAVFGFATGLDFKKEINMAFELAFGIKRDLDSLADHAQADIKRLERLAARVEDAEAHHTFALAEQQLSAGDEDAARQTLALIQDVYPLSPWSERAALRVEALDNRAVAGVAAAPSATGETLQDPSSSDTFGVIGVLIGVFGLAIGGFMAWGFRRKYQRAAEERA